MEEKASSDYSPDSISNEGHDSVSEVIDPRETLDRWRIGSLREVEVPEGSVSEPAGKWPDEESQKAAGLLVRKGVDIPWTYRSELGEKNFEIVGLRAGGVGVVYFVESSRHDKKRRYAAKTLNSFLKPDYLELSPPVQEKISQAFLEEALPWLEMGQHPHMVSVHLLKNIVHPELNRNIPFVFSDYMPGGNLRGYLDKKGRLTVQESLTLGIQLCDGLLHAYSHGLESHQDIKPENIMVYEEGLFQVTDFGANVIGTPGYMAPEQVAALWRRRGKEIIPDPVSLDHRVDQFAVGLVMLESFNGSHPFAICQNAVRDREKAERYVSEGVGEIVGDALDDAFRGILRRILSSVPDDRYPDLLTLREELLECHESKYGAYEVQEVAKDDSAEWWHHRGEAFYTLGRPVLAEAPFQKAMERYDRIPGAEFEAAKCTMHLGRVYRDTGQFPEAENTIKRASSIFSGMPGTELEQATCKRNLGILFIQTHSYAEAEEAIEDALRSYRNISGTEREQAGSIMSMGNILFGTGRFQEAENEFKKALEIFPEIPGTELDQAKCFLNLGAVFNQTGRSRDAETAYKKALKVFQSIPGTEFARAMCFLNLGGALFETNRRAESEESLVESLRIFRIIPGTELEQATCVENLGNLYREMGRYQESELEYQEALKIYRDFPETEFHQARCTAEFARCYWLMSNPIKARRLAQEALKICEPFPAGSIKKIQLYCREILEEDEEEE